VTDHGREAGHRCLFSRRLQRPGDTDRVPDHQETCLRGVVGFLGITDVTFIRAEGVNIGADRRTEPIEAAYAEIDQVAA
jgi:FMN-dependent NADH-azoreductase